ncbi:triacylglycerol esterase/lipase EstA (alpha/beta hydrolase family) [Allocatelliglobosispora scoriae]|uniref:Triacylglycerol esterase/lipase EstA (Alpha/beta hydrolase family) n=1 Tax=Allocatelliglobosispora scoriae TaxID=643052 RepID=A0A841BSP7_9ACTN|nr:hypothetical protein [Allocatelliglobosispora scoriae]MBB5870209.1 triacylglycerol esterase/lipase EstA (alpha/beta hydrolase family) [Allocatelliglobosispora scoriae]
MSRKTWLLGVVVTAALTVPLAAPAGAAPGSPAPAGAAAASSAVQVAGGADIDALVAAAVAKPKRANSVNRPIYLVHGYSVDGKGWDCEGYWWRAKAGLRAGGWKGPIITFGYYANDRNCDVTFKGTRNTSITRIGEELANAIYKRDTRYGRSADIIAHSMGGLVARAALTGTSQGWPYFPRTLYVEDVVTLSTPHGGVPLIGFCSNNIEQCFEMRRNSPFLRQMDYYPSPQSSIGTDWTLIGADNDYVVPAWSAIAMRNVGHMVVFYKNKAIPVNHQSIHKITSGVFKVRYWNYTDKKWHTVNNGAHPVRTAQNAAYWWYRW